MSGEDKKKKKRRRLLICLHGSGDTGGGIRDWITSLDRDFEKTMRDNDVDIVFPSAELRPYSMAGGMEMRVWFDRKGLGAKFPEDKEGVRYSVNKIASAFDKKTYGDVSVLGFSQGGCLALHLGLGPSSFCDRIRSVVCMSSFLYDDSELFSFLKERRNSPPPLLMMHGKEDNMVPMELGRKTFERFKGISKIWNTQWSEISDLSHDISREEVVKARNFIANRFIT